MKFVDCQACFLKQDYNLSHIETQQEFEDITLNSFREKGIHDYFLTLDNFYKYHNSENNYTLLCPHFILNIYNQLFKARALAIQRINNKITIYICKSGSAITRDYKEYVSYVYYVFKEFLKTDISDIILIYNSPVHQSLIDVAIYNYDFINTKLKEYAEISSLPKLEHHFSCNEFKRKNPRHICNLYRLSTKTKQELINRNITQIKDIDLDPDEMSLVQRMQYIANTLDNEVINKTELELYIDKYKHKRIAFLDFETIVNGKIRNTLEFNENIPIMYSIVKNGKQFTYHIVEISSSKIKTFCEHLIEDLKDVDIIFAHHATFELNCIETLIKLNKSMSKELCEIYDKIEDTEDIFKNSYYHPDMGGSYSLKVLSKVLLKKDYDFSGLIIKNGDEASYYMRQIITFIRPYDTIIVNDIIEYCKLDTIALYDIYNYIMNIINNENVAVYNNKN